MNTCDTCKHWSAQTHIPIRPIQNKCLNEKVTGRKGPRFMDENLLFIATIQESEIDGLYTGPKFGCIHWESQEIAMKYLCAHPS